MISIVTPTYNRSSLLKRLYQSLKAQSCHDFEWIVIDDGSTDGTRSVINRFIFENILNITHLQQENSGKHVALNTAIKHCRGQWIFVVDSDDMLTPDAISVLYRHILQIKDNQRFCGISAAKMLSDNKIIGRQPKLPITDMAFFEFYHRRSYTGDRALVFRTDLLHRNPFPVFENEKFLPEGIVWETISRDKLVRFINEPIYICEYRSDGLSAGYHSLMVANPVGNALYYKILSEHPEATFLTRLRCSFMHYYLLKSAMKKGCDVSSIQPSARLKAYHKVAPLLVPLYKFKSLFRQNKVSK